MLITPKQDLHDHAASAEIDRCTQDVRLRLSAKTPIAGQKLRERAIKSPRNPQGFGEEPPVNSGRARRGTPADEGPPSQGEDSQVFSRLSWGAQGHLKASTYP